MSDRLDRVESLLEAHRMGIADLRTRQEVTQLQIESLTTQGAEINKKIDRTSALIAELASIVFHNS